MTNEQLIQLVQERLPEELSLEEIELLRQRAGESAELRSALAEHLRFESLLTGSLSRHEVSVNTILDHGRTNGKFLNWRWGVAALLVLVAAGVALVARPPGRPNDEPETVADATVAPPRASQPDAEAAGSVSAGKSSVPPATSTTATEPAAAPVDPWTIPADPPRRPFAETCFVEVAPLATDAEAEQLKNAWQIVKGNATPVLKASRDRSDRPLGGLSMTGQFKLRAAWPAGHVWRLATSDAENVRWIFWHGLDGVTLQYVDRPARTWLAYRTRRGQGDFDPQDSILAAGDEGRFRRSERGTFELRWQDGLLVLSRGDVLLLSVPLSGHPDSVALETVRPLVLNGMTVYPGERFPIHELAPSNAPAKLAGQPPAQRSWTKELPEGTKFNALPDGSVELVARDNSKPAWASVPIGADALQELIFRVGDLDAGTGLLLADSEGQPLVGVGLVDSRFQRGKIVEKELVWTYAQPRDRQSESRGDRQLPQPLAGPGQWVRLVVAGGAVKVWASDDGRSWARACEPRTIDPPLARVGLYSIAGKGSRRISLRQFDERPLSAWRTLADDVPRANLDACLAKLVAAPEIGAWLETALANQPAGVSELAWCRACAVQTLMAEPRGSLAHALVLPQAEAIAGAASLPPEKRLTMLDDWSLVADTLDQSGAVRLLRAYQQIAREGFETGRPRPFSQLRHAYLQSPFWSTINLAGWQSPPVREELLQLVYAGDWNSLARFCEETRFFWQPQNVAADDRSGEWNDTVALLNWAETLAQRNRPQQPGAVLARPVVAGWRHPLVEQFGKEGYNVLAELQATLEGGAYKDACQIITSMTVEQATGLLPSSHDPALLVSLPGAVALAMQDHEALRRTMQDEFGPLGQLRLRQAVAQGDAAEVQALATRFYGTLAADEAHQWLGDRALAQGDFARAEGHYHAALGDAEPADRPQIAARLRLAAAMLGRDFGEPPTEPVALGAKSLPPPAFEQMVAQLKRRSQGQSGGRASSGPAAGGASQALPEPHAYRLRSVAKLKPRPERDPRIRRDQDWIASQTVTAPAGDLLLVSLRSELTAFNPGGDRAWTLAVDSPGRGDRWPLVAMQPVVENPADPKSKVYVRRLLESGTELACVQDGQLVWRSPRGENVASDPLLAADRLVAVIVSSAQQEMLQLSLASFDRASGKILSQRPLAQFRDIWQRELACQLAQVGDTLVVVGGGTVIGCNLDGEPKWLRRETWLAGVFDQRAGGGRYDAPVARDKWVYVAQPAVPSVACLQVRTGRLQWQQSLSNLVRILGLAGDKLIVQTTDGFAAFDAETGRRAWGLDAPQIIFAQCADSADTLWYAQREPFGSKQFRVRLAWLDARTGRPVAAAPIVQWHVDQPALGLLAARGGPWWVLAGPQVNDPARELFVLEPAGPADPSDRSTETILTMAEPTAGLGVTLQGGWQMLSNQTDNKAGWQAEYAGETEVFLTTATNDRPARWLRHVDLPADRPAKLRARVAAVGKGTAKLVIAAGGAVLAERTLEPGPWQTVEVDLSALAGRSVWIVARHEVPAGRNNIAWKSIELQTAIDQ